MYVRRCGLKILSSTHFSLSLMTDNNHPITPPPELVQQWMQEASGQPPGPDARVIATLAARWGADQELEACCEWLEDHDCDDPQEVAKRLRAARRPKPLSLKEQALLLCNDYIDPEGIIRRALESLPD